MKRAVTFAVCVLGALFPERLLRWNARLNLVGYRNVADVEPKPWLVFTTRVVSTLVVAWMLRGLRRPGDGGEDEDLVEIEVDVV